MDLFILRHGQAGRSSPARDDSKRGLTVEGEKEIRDIAKGLRALGIEFDHILTSPLVRSRQTAELVFQIVGHKNQVQEMEELKPEGSKSQLFSKLSKFRRDSTVLVVGHEPYLSELIAGAISNGQCKIDLKKGGVARIRVTNILPALKGELRWLLTPKHLKRMA